MLIGLIADTHNNQQTTKAALARFRQAQIETLLHAGDVTNVKTLRLFAGFDLWIARGNIDHDPNLLTVAVELFGPGRLADVHRLTFDGVHIAMTHGSSWQRLTALIRDKSNTYVIHGHTHTPRDERARATDGSTTRVINPGAIGNSRWKSPTCAILDLATGALELIEF